MSWKFWFFGKAMGTNTTQHQPVTTPPEPVEPTKHLSNLDVEEIRSVVREELSQSQLDYDRLANVIATTLNDANRQEYEQHKNIIARLRSVASTFAWLSPCINTIIACFAIWILIQCFGTWSAQGQIYATVLSCVNMLGVVVLTILQWILFRRIHNELKHSESVSVLVGIIATDTALIMTVVSLLSLMLPNDITCICNNIIPTST